VVEDAKEYKKEEKVEEVKQTDEDNNGTGDWLDDIPFAPIGLQYPQILWCM
jgi:hypothetical protein